MTLSAYKEQEGQNCSLLCHTEDVSRCVTPNIIKPRRQTPTKKSCRRHTPTVKPPPLTVVLLLVVQFTYTYLGSVCPFILWKFLNKQNKCKFCIDLTKSFCFGYDWWIYIYITLYSTSYPTSFRHLQTLSWQITAKFVEKYTVIWFIIFNLLLFRKSFLIVLPTIFLTSLQAFS